MIIWINGAFGSGKTQTSYELHRRIPNSYVYDPENAGFFIRKNIPKETHKGDFQNYAMWREFNYSMLKYIDHEYAGIIIVPMTIVNPKYFDEIIGSLRQCGVDIRHYTLMASKETLLHRLKSRGDGVNSWGAKQIDRCLEGLSKDVFREHIDTEKMSIEQVVEKIALMSDINLLPDNMGRLRRKINRIIIQLKQVRLFSWRI